MMELPSFFQGGDVKNPPWRIFNWGGGTAIQAGLKGLSNEI